jgi:hypothetical protein
VQRFLAVLLNRGPGSAKQREERCIAPGHEKPKRRAFIRAAFCCVPLLKI